MRDYTYPVAAGMLVIGASLMLFAATAANAASSNSTGTHVGSIAHNHNQPSRNGARIHMLIQQEADLQMELQRATAIHERSKKSADDGHKPNPGCVICKID